MSGDPQGDERFYFAASAPSQDLGMLVFWDQCLYTDWGTFVILGDMPTLSAQKSLQNLLFCVCFGKDFILIFVS
jgi:hypothetical protein